MSFKKKTLAALAAGAIMASAGSALALENEFHGMFRFMGYGGNFFNGASGTLKDNAHSGTFAEQRARIQYTAKANDDLKLVTHFELDTRFGGKAEAGYLGAGNDAGNLDADQLTLETKDVYLDFNCPITKANVKVGLQPWNDAYNSIFLLADMTGVNVTKKFDPLTLSLGWFRFDDDTAKGTADVGDLTSDLFVADAKYAINKSISLGASYYYIENDRPATAYTVGIEGYESLHMIGANASIKAGPATINPFFAYQFGDAVEASDHEISAFLAGATAKVKLGPGNITATTIYLSGDGDINDKDVESFQIVSPSTTNTTVTSYFNPANMWLLVRNGAAINSSGNHILGNDLSVGGHGLILATLGYEGTAGKLFYNANVGHARAAEDRNRDERIGTEINAQVGYKLFDNLTASVAGAYAFLGNGLNGDTAQRLDKNTTTKFGATNADDPYMVNLQLAYAF